MHFEVDPSFLAVSVPASKEHLGHRVKTISGLEMRRFVRIYMPRTYSDLIAKHDYVVISDANRGFFDKELAWMRRGVGEEGLGLIMVGGHESFGGWSNPSWANTEIAEVLPVTMDEPMYHGRVYKVKPATDHPFTRSLPWETIPFFHDGNHVALKEGATLLLTTEIHPYPPLSTWKVGRGVTIAHSMDWTPGGGAHVMRWEYFPDYVANIAYLAVRHDISDNPALIHRLRSRFFDLRTSMVMSMDVVAFAEMFGANVVPLERRLIEVGEMKEEADQLYLDQSFDDVLEKMADIGEVLMEVHESAIRIKDQALFWVYLVEWLAVTGSSLACGFVLWTLMVRRKLYREVVTTRLGAA